MLTTDQKQQALSPVKQAVQMLGDAEYLRTFNACDGASATDPTVLAEAIVTEVFALRAAKPLSKPRAKS
jgi:hypothetical protein